jgi:hypothetical protein
VGDDGRIDDLRQEFFGDCGNLEGAYRFTSVTYFPMKHLFVLFSLVAGFAFLAGCSTPESRIAKQPELFNRLTPDQQQMIREGRVGVGFDMEMVKLALGDPDRVRERTDSNGRSEVLLYRGWYHRGWGSPFYPYYLDIPGRRERSRDEVVFRDGRVISVEQERR